MNFAPHQAGIYGTATDLVRAERKQGLDVDVVDYGNGRDAPQRHSRVGCKDGDITTVAPEHALESDVIVRHSALPQTVFDSDIPLVMPFHGMPEYTFLLEHTGNTRTLKELMVSTANPRYKAFLTMWRETVFYWEAMFSGKKIFYVPPPVDLDKFNPLGKTYTFKEPGKINIVIAGVWRKEYTTPYSVLFNAAKFVRDKCPEARVHVFGVPYDNKKYTDKIKNDGPVNHTLLALRKGKMVGECRHIVTNLDEIYRAADIAVTQHTVASRTVREALASGCPLVAASGNKYTPYTADPRDPEAFASAIENCYKDIMRDRETVRQVARQKAEQEFNLDRVGKAMKRVFEYAMENK
ncbi:glycosyltransferase family 4 protein [Neptuniibacter sp.]|uniref:glycosyltransferase family 4 protein n=1 Tax=Neptuniibacter sp. TaxID=1962643 RepID=UPI00260EFE5C|nr:glycosyltransferase family 4 protein [Neptuniibacter sp.]MCP4598511.1 glycosyltransferase family 4 protein [Neptuniibacter sp.]